MKKTFCNTKEIALIGFWGPYNAYKSEDYDFPCLRTDEVYKRIKEGGYNIIVQTNESWPENKDEVMESIRLCKKYGIKYMSYSRSLMDLTAFHKRETLPRVESEEYIEKTLKDLLKNKTVCGIYAVDEPFQNAYPSLGVFNDRFANVMKKLGKEDSSCYVNLLPKCGFTGMGPGEYESYVEEVYTVGKTKHINFDFYPFRHDETSPGLYNIYGVIRQTAIKHNIPFGACIQMGGNWTEEEDNIGVKRPLPEEVLWEVNFFVCTGCTAITYFTLCNPHSYFKYIPNHGETGALLPNGEKSDLFEPAKEANFTAKAFSKVIMNAKPSIVIFNKGFPSCFEDKFEDFHVGGGYKELKNVKGKGVITGCFDYKGKSAFGVVNTFELDQKVTLNFDKVYKLQVISDKKTYTIKTDKLVLDLLKGQARLVVIK